MPRTEFVIDRDRSCGEVTVEVTERYTLKQACDDGRVIWHDGKDLWLAGGFSWHGAAPASWDATKAEPAEFTRKYDQVLDLS